LDNIQTGSLEEVKMIRVFIHNWWLLALRGAFALVFAGFVFWLQPFEGFFVTRPLVHAGLVVIFGLLALGAGTSTIVAAVYRAGKDRSHLLLWDGIAICVAGLVIVLAPKMDLNRLVHLIAGWAIVVGVLELLIARTVRRHIPDEWSMSLAGVSSLILGTYFLLSRSYEDVFLTRWLGTYAAFSAVTILALAFRLHALASSVHHAAERAELRASK
jgi:uncharacterized membrane protein HdeD (DUF308 family)